VNGRKGRSPGGLAAAAAVLGVLFSGFVAFSAAGESPPPTPLLFLGNQNIAPVVYLEDGAPAGVAVDIVRALARHIPEPIEIRAMEWAQAQTMVARGDAAALIQINPTEERKKIFDFSDPLLESQFSIFVRADRAGVLGMSSLRGLRVGVEAAGLPRQTLSADPEIHLTVIANFVDGFRQLSAGAVDAVVVDYRVGSYVLGVNQIANVKAAGEPIAFSNSAIAVKKGNAKLLGEIDSALQAIRADGSYQTIIDKWRPTEAVFETREQIERRNHQATLIVLAVGLLVVAAWTATLMRNVAKRQQVEEQLRRVNRARLAVRMCNQALIHAADETALVQQLCQIIVEQAGYRLAWVGYAEQDEAKTVRPVALAGFEDGYVALANITWADAERGRGPTGACIRTGRIQSAGDLATEPKMAPWRDDALRRGYASSVALPLQANGKPFGALTIYSSENDAFADEEIGLLSELSGDLGYGIVSLRTRAERQRAEEALRRSNRQLRALMDCNQALIRATDEVALVQRICEIFIEEAGYRLAWVGYAEYDPAKSVRFIAEAGHDDGYLEAAKITWADDSERGQGVGGLCIRTGKTQISQDIATDPRMALWRDAALQRGYASSIALALVDQGKPFGVILAYSSEVGAFGDGEVGLLSELAGNLSYGIVSLRAQVSRARAAEALRRSNRQLRALIDCNQALVHAAVETALVQQVCQIIVEEAGYRLAWVGYAERDAAKTVRPIAQAGFAEGYVASASVTWADDTRGRGPMGACIRTGRIQFTGNIATEAKMAPWRADALRRGYAAGVCIPLVDRGKPFGAIAIYAAETDAFGEEDVSLLNELAGDLGYGIMSLRTQAERKRAEEALRLSNRRLRALSNCNQALIHATDEAALVQEICQIIVDEAGFRLAWVGYGEHDAAKTVRPIAQAGFADGYVALANITWADRARGRGPIGTCIRTGATQIVNNFDANPRTAPWRDEARRRGYASCAAIPLMDAGRPFGALSIYSSEVEAFKDEEIGLLSELAGDLSYGIVSLRTEAERKRTEVEKIAREHDVAISFKIQQMLLLEEPPRDVPGLSVAALCIPSQRIAGDFYGFFTHEDQSLDLIVADAMGKGIPAALLAAATKNHFMRALCRLIALSPPGALPEPKAIVGLANAGMRGALVDLESFVTLCYARVDLSHGRLVVVDCGHTGVIRVRRHSGGCELIHGQDLPLGVGEGDAFSQFAIPFENGDMFLFYSDGITEAGDAQREMFGVDRLMACVGANEALSPDALVEAIRLAVVSFVGSDQVTDDLTCVAVEVGGAPHAVARQEMEIGSDLSELGRARGFVRGFCRALPGPPLGEDQVAELALAVNEAASNIMKHAYHGRIDQRIRLDIESASDQIVVRLHHHGDPFDPPPAPESAFDGSRESGYGLYILSRSVDYVRYYLDERGENCVALVKMYGP
jgi:GAF domain-containing protein/ABC-type amino acid transport substrate-binding protein/anti-sigma regulatory factor (Ser/Thr protein kinase)